MKTGIVHMTKITPNGITASARIARFIHSRLPNSELIDNKDAAIGSYDRLIIVNGPMAFCDFLPALAEVIRRSEKLIWVQNDYTCKPPSTSPNGAESPFRKAFAEYGKPLIYWTSVPGNMQTSECRYIDWQKLTFTGTRSYSPTVIGLCYYGAYRNDREESFSRYFWTDRYPVIISSAVAKKFRSNFPKVNTIPKFNNPLCEELSKFQASLYIQDKYSNSNFCSIGNRFYETLSAGIPLAIDHKTLNTFKLSDIPVEDYWVVYDARTAKEFLSNSHKIASAQREAWNRNYVEELTRSVDEALC